MDVWDLLAYEEHPDDPDLGYLDDLEDEELQYQTELFANICDGVKLACMGPAITILREEIEAQASEEDNLVHQFEAL